MEWTVNTKKIEKQAKKLSEKIRLALRSLIEEMQQNGPERKNWPHYSKLKGKKGDKRHCHIKQGKPTYVCCWEVINKEIHIIEVYYVGTHENAPY